MLVAHIVNPRIIMRAMIVIAISPPIKGLVCLSIYKRYFAVFV